ncbi:YjcZ family sporulation protein [Bacillus sp. sid0103]|nr:YjcZ family sporulation protein [Bacillus sp. sid0103]MBV7508930.1 YjcZ family sporulation protein [Bacillus sp. sid0103]
MRGWFKTRSALVVVLLVLLIIVGASFIGGF